MLNYPKCCGMNIPISNILKKMVFFNSWHTGGANTYLKLPSNITNSEFEQQIKNIASDYVGKDFKAWGQT